MEKNSLALSSITQKYVMALAGLFLMVFLVFHLATNLLMLLGDDGESFREAVNFLTTNPAVKIMEYALFAGFLVHILIGFILQLYNYKARPVRYHKTLQTETSPFSRYMFHTGVIVLIFLVLHLLHFFFVKLGWVPVDMLYEGIREKDDFYSMSIQLFQNPLFSALYVVAFVFLGFHLKHAFQSAFQSLGLNHTKYTPVIKVVGTIYALLISIGFSIIPIYFYFFHTT